MQVLPVVPMFHAMAWGIPYCVLMTGCKMCLASSLARPHARMNARMKRPQAPHLSRTRSLARRHTRAHAWTHARRCLISRFLTPDAIVRFIVDHGVTMSGAVPTIWQVHWQGLSVSPVVELIMLFRGHW